MSHIEIGSDIHRIAIDVTEASLTELAATAEKLWHATRPDLTPRTTIGPTATAHIEKAYGPDYASAHPVDL